MDSPCMLLTIFSWNKKMNTMFMEKINELIVKGYGTASLMMESLVSAERFEKQLSSERREFVSHVEHEGPVEASIIARLKADGYLIMPLPICQSVFCYKRVNAHTECCARYTITNSTLTFVSIGDLDEVNRTQQWAHDQFYVEGSYVEVASYIPSGGGIVYDKNFLIKADQRLARQSFYPWIDEPLKDYYKAFLVSPESVMILLGPPGTGKSTFLRSLIVESGVAATLAYSKQVVESPMLMSDFFSSAAKILAYEDIDNHLKAREEDNDLMATILNMSEGIVKHKKKKIMFSTNLPSTDKIDPALLRKGRCFDIAKFRELTFIEAKRVWEDVNLPEKSFNGRTSMSLAEILSTEEDRQAGIGNRKKQGAGFV